MSGLNSCAFIGNLGADPETRYTAGGDCVTNFRIAVNEKWKKDGETHERTEWVRCVAWRKTGELAAEYLRKGNSVYISGKMQTRKWQDRDGQDRYTTEIVVRDMVFIGGGGAGGGTARPPGPGKESSASNPAPPIEPDQQDFDDDIPF